MIRTEVVIELDPMCPPLTRCWVNGQMVIVVGYAVEQKDAGQPPTVTLTLMPDSITLRPIGRAAMVPDETAGHRVRRWPVDEQIASLPPADPRLMAER